MPYLDSKIVEFINFFYEEAKKQKMPWAVNCYLYDPSVISDFGIRVNNNDIHKQYMLYFSKEKILSSSYEQLTKYAFEEAKKEFDRWNSENH